MSKTDTVNEADILPAPTIEVPKVPAYPPPVPQDPKLRREHEVLLRLGRSCSRRTTGNTWPSTRARWWGPDQTKSLLPWGPTGALATFRSMCIW